jgi:hypothetical protein
MEGFAHEHSCIELSLTPELASQNMTTDQQSAGWLNLTSIVASARKGRTVHTQPDKWITRSEGTTRATIRFEICKADGGEDSVDVMLPSPPHTIASDRMSCAEKALKDGLGYLPLAQASHGPVERTQYNDCDHDHCVWTLIMHPPREPEGPACDVTTGASYQHIPAALIYNLDRPTSASGETSGENASLPGP